MANGSTDIVLGVALAADPERYRAAAERLRSMSAEAASGGNVNIEAFSASVEKALADSVASRPAVLANASPRISAMSVRQTGGNAFGELEAFVLQTFIQSMLPKNASNVFGKGSAGEIWKSMLAEKLGHEVARSGQLGIAARLRSASVAGALSVAQGTQRLAGKGDEANPSQPPTSLEKG